MIQTSNSKIVISFCAVFSLFLAGTILGAPETRDNFQQEQDLWGLYLRGDLVVPDRDESDELSLEFGWPRRIPTDAPLWGRSPAIVDIDQNGDWEIAIVNGDGRLFVYQHDGALFPGFPTRQYRGNRPEPWENPTHRAMVSVGDIDRDDSPDLTYLTDIGHLHVVGRNQHEPNPFPLDLNHGVQASSAVTLDVNNNQSCEMIFTTFFVRPLNGEEALLHVLDAGGNELEGWPVRCGIGSGSSPAVGDIDGDGAFEIVIASGRSGGTPGRIWAFELDGSRVNGFPQGSYESIDGSVVLAAWDRGAGLDIIYAAAPFDGNQYALYALNFRGAVIAGFPKRVAHGHPFGNPIVTGETNERLYSEITFGEFDPNGHSLVQSFHRLTENDSLIESFAQDAGVGVVGSVVSADIFGDSGTEVVAALVPTGDNEGRILIANNESTVYIDLADYGGGAFASSPTLWDVDRDRHTEIIAVTTDGRLFVWHTDGMFSGDIWPTERGDFARSGRKLPSHVLSVGGESGFDTVPARFLLNSYPNPFNSRIAISVSSPSSGKLLVGLYDLTGRMIVANTSDLKVGGEANFTFDAGNLGLSSGVYFVRWSVGSFINGSRPVVYLP